MARLPNTPKTLLRKAKAESEVSNAELQEAWRLLYEDFYKKPMTDLAERLLGPGAENAEDIALSVFQKAVDSFDEEKSCSFHEWVRRIMANEVRSDFRSCKAAKRIPKNKKVSIDAPLSGDDEGGSLEEKIAAPLSDNDKVAMFECLDRPVREKVLSGWAVRKGSKTKDVVRFLGDMGYGLASADEKTAMLDKAVKKFSLPREKCREIWRCYKEALDNFGRRYSDRCSSLLRTLYRSSGDPRILDLANC